MTLYRQVNEYARAQYTVEKTNRVERRNVPLIFRDHDQVQATVVGLNFDTGSLRVKVGEQEYNTIPRGRTSIPAGRRVTLVYEKGAIQSYW